MGSWLSIVVLLLHSTSLTLGAPSVVARADVLIPREAPSITTPDHKVPLPARKTKHRIHHKKSSAASARAKRTPEDHELQERQALESLPVADLLAGGVPSLPGIGQRDVVPTTSSPLSLLDLNGLLSTCSGGMGTHQAAIAKAAKKAKTYKDSRMNSPFQNSVFQELKAYRGSAAGLPGLRELDASLKPLAPKQGLGNFNRNDPNQVLLRTIVTSLEDTLEGVDLIVYYLPILGPVLGPIVYDIKCIIDDLLDIAHYTADGLLNSLAPQLRILQGNYMTSTCKMGPSLPMC
ncbi:hypothetical protein MNV49_003697 [Pseudohyphozyma bogoriensis]|nr:hypothetical protein MNV49_003697 [Pseudohyphozyma bogoriensis]